MDDNIVGEMHLDVMKVNTDSQAPLEISIDSDNDTVSGYFFNFHDHKPTFKVGVKDKPRVALTGGLLSATYIMDQFHFHVYCTRSEAEDSTLDKSQVPGEVSERESSASPKLPTIARVILVQRNACQMEREF